MADPEIVHDVQTTAEYVTRPDVGRGLGGTAVGSELRYLIETAKQLTREVGVSHSVVTDIHGKPAVVINYKRKNKR
ncbi:hypothetical protein H6800_01505 [Candidatus Nomurabacteria bacterium]|nr:hypothetical protein [Candidatus Nomurabacteria bacterium]